MANEYPNNRFPSSSHVKYPFKTRLVTSSPSRSLVRLVASHLVAPDDYVLLLRFNLAGKETERCGRRSGDCPGVPASVELAGEQIWV